MFVYAVVNYVLVHNLGDCEGYIYTVYHHYHESFEAEKFCSKLYTHTFTKKLSWNPSYLNSAILNFHIKSFVDIQKL